MLELSQIISQYPASLQSKSQFILREYLQYKILSIIFEKKENAQQLTFIGGTALRIIYGNNRFSEDIDFDNTGITQNDFEKITGQVKDSLEKEGYEVEFENVYRGAYHCLIKFPALLQKEGLTKHKEEKILIQLDTEPQKYDYKPEQILLNKFDVFTQIAVAPKNLLLSQKFYAAINRKRAKGRDFYDIVFLFSIGAKPDYQFLKQKLGIANFTKLKSAIVEKCKTLDMERMATDVAPFLFNPNDKIKVTQFQKYISQLNKV